MGDLMEYMGDGQSGFSIRDERTEEGRQERMAAAGISLDTLEPNAHNSHNSFLALAFKQMHDCGFTWAGRDKALRGELLFKCKKHSYGHVDMFYYRANKVAVY